MAATAITRELRISHGARLREGADSTNSVQPRQCRVCGLVETSLHVCERCGGGFCVNHIEVVVGWLTRLPRTCVLCKEHDELLPPGEQLEVLALDELKTLSMLDDDAGRRASYMLGRFRGTASALPDLGYSEWDARMMLHNRDTFEGHVKVWGPAVLRALRPRDFETGGGELRTWFYLQVISKIHPSKHLADEALGCDSRCRSYLLPWDLLLLCASAAEHASSIGLLALDVLQVSRDSVAIQFLPFLRRRLLLDCERRCSFETTVADRICQLASRNSKFAELAHADLYAHLHCAIAQAPGRLPLFVRLWKELRNNSGDESAAERVRRRDLNMASILRLANALSIRPDPGRDAMPVAGVRDAIRARLEMTENPFPLTLPWAPDVVVTGLDIERIQVLPSARRPLLVQCQVADATNVVPPVLLFKIGDDVRRDCMVVAALALVDALVRAPTGGLEPILVTYAVLPTGRDSGFIEYLPSTQTLSQLIANQSDLESFMHDQSGLQTAARRERLVLTASAWCAVNYVFGITDRHPGNILVRHDGTVVHIDFSFILREKEDPRHDSNALPIDPMTSEFLRSKKLEHAFIDHAAAVFNTLRAHAVLIFHLLLQMVAESPAVPAADAASPRQNDFGSDEAKLVGSQLRARLFVGLDDAAAEQTFRELAVKALQPQPPHEPHDSRLRSWAAALGSMIKS